MFETRDALYLNDVMFFIVAVHCLPKDNLNLWLIDVKNKMSSNSHWRKYYRTNENISVALTEKLVAVTEIFLALKKWELTEIAAVITKNRVRLRLKMFQNGFLLPTDLKFAFLTENIARLTF